MGVAGMIYVTLQAFIILYLFSYNSLNLFLLFIAFAKVRTHLREHYVCDTDFVYNSPYTPSISVIVAAFNEEKSIIESLHSLMKLHYPRYEIVVVNDGSTDNTLDKLCRTFLFMRRNIGYETAIGTARIRGTYEANIEADSSLFRFVVVDKENGGKADAVNCGINAAKGDFVCTIDADSILDSETLLQVVLPIVSEPDRVVASGGQVSIVNGCKVRNGRVVKARLSNKILPLFQTAEYMRAFTAGRTAFEMLDCLLILSGAFAVIQRRILIEIGGFMTPYMKSRIAQEYCGNRPFTICEDMEVIVRIWRYIYDKKEKKRIAFVPRPICWTEVPESLKDLGSQRSRWCRGLWEIMRYHRGTLFNSSYGRVGMFALPYQLLFEAIGPLVETFGYVSLPVLWMLGILNVNYLIIFFLAATVYGTILSIAGVLLGLWQENAVYGLENPVSLFRYKSFRDKMMLILCTVALNAGYRQLTLYYQCKGFIDFLKGERGWEKLNRVGFS